VRGMFGATVGQLAEDYRQRGLAEAVARFESMRLEDPRLRLGTDCLEHVVPLRRLADEFLYYADVIGREGLGPGSRSALERWNLFPRVEMHGAASQVVANEAFLAFGNHPAGIEAIFFVALLRREDVYFFGGSHIKQISPSLARKVIAIDNTTARVRARRRVTLSDRFAHGVGELVWAPSDDNTARARNSNAVERAAKLIGVERAGVHIFPTGSMDPGAGWQRGIGRIVRELLRDESIPTSSVFLVPVVYDVSSVHVMASAMFPPRSALRWLAQLRVWTWTGPPSVFVPRPVALGELKLDAGESPEVITRALHEIWQAASTQARAAIPRWAPLRGAHIWLSRRS
jgi:hypothetical protein